MSRSTKESPSIVFALGLAIYLFLAVLILGCVGFLIGPAKEVVHETQLSLATLGLLFVLTGLMIVFLFHFSRQMSLTTAHVKPQQRIPFPVGVSAGLATLGAVCSLGWFALNAEQPKFESSVVVHVDSSTPEFPLNLLPSTDFWHNLAKDQAVTSTQQFGVTHRNVAALQESTHIERSDDGNLRITLRSPDSEQGAQVLAVVTQSLLRELESQPENARTKAVQTALDIRAKQAQRVRELSARLLELEPGLKLTANQPAGAAMNASLLSSPAPAQALDWRTQLQQVELANAVEIYAELDREVSRLEMLPDVTPQVVLSAADVTTSRLPDSHSPLAWSVAVFVLILQLVLCFWLLARLSQRRALRAQPKWQLNL